MLVYRIRWYCTVLNKKKAAFSGLLFCEAGATERQKLVNYVFDLQIYYFHQLAIYPQIYPHFAQVKIFSLSRA